MLHNKLLQLTYNFTLLRLYTAFCFMRTCTVMLMQLQVRGAGADQQENRY